MVRTESVPPAPAMFAELGLPFNRINNLLENLKITDQFDW
jgi:hypothetical protein